MHKQGKNARMDESLGMKHGKESKHKQSMKDRRHESKGASGKTGLKTPMGHKGK
jgi:hypothetical protein